MENVSKALIIAGSILLAMITISIFYFAFGKASSLTEAISENTNQKELIAFNNSFEAYNKKVMYGAEIVSVLNKAIDNNKSYNIDEKLKDYYVNIEFRYNGKVYSLEKDPVIIQKEFIDMAKKSDKDKEYIDGSTYKDQVDAFHQFKFTAFKCEKIIYNTKNNLENKSSTGAIGRVKEMKFVPIK